jgi:hypothetical protein
MKSKGVSGTSCTLAQEIVNGYAEKHRGLLLPTPLTRDYKGGTTAIRKDTGKVRTDALDSLVKYMDENGMLPTPMAGDCHNGCPAWSARMLSKAEHGWTIQLNDLATMGRLGDVESTKSEAAGGTSRLSPLFTEEMMGFPFLWTTLPFLGLNGDQRMQTEKEETSATGGPKASKPTATPSSHK